MKPKVVRKYHVPYIAGYNIDGSVIYIDKRLPKTVPGTSIKTEKYLLVHEITEQRLEDTMGMSYKESHHIATAAEMTSLIRDGHGVNRKAYDEFYDEWSKTCRKDFSSVPPDLDLDPYLQEKDTEVLEKMRAVGHNLLPTKKK